ncbi:MAG: AAA-like domain-containing protein [Ardenticatenaceae bacterium]
MLTNAMIVAATQVIFDHILTESGVPNHLANNLRSWLGRDPQRLAFQEALTGAYNKFAAIHPDFAAALFDEHFLKNRAAPLLARCLPPADPPEPSQLASAFADERNLKGAAHKRCVVKTTPIAEQFLNELRRQLRAREEFKPLFDSIELERTAIATRQTADALQALDAKLEQLLAQQPSSVTITIISDKNLNESPNPGLSTTRREISGMLAPLSNVLTKRLGWLRRALIGSPPAQATRLFICYERNAHKDSQVADYLYNYLTDQGYEVFMDKPVPAETPWSEPIERQIKGSEFLIVLLSPQSADSEMVQAQVRGAYEYRQSQGQPQILPIRLAYEGRLPYAIDFLGSLQYVIWQSAEDNQRVGEHILAAMRGDLPPQPPIQPRLPRTEVIVSEDGRIVTGQEGLQAPLPEADPRFLDELVVPGGALTLRDTLYVAREADAKLKRQVVKTGTLTTIRAPHQTGKTSLFVRAVHHARQHNMNVVTLDMQRVNQDALQTLDHFLRYLAEYIIRKLRLKVNLVHEWDGELPPQDKLTMLLEDYVLSASGKPIMLAMDEVDRLLDTDFHTDFFALIRSWHDSKAYEAHWDKLNLIQVISTEPSLLIADQNQSPFNVGLRLYLKDFNEAQVRDLNQRHQAPVLEQEIPQLMTLLNGHPYLTRNALYTLVTEQLSWAELTRIAISEQGPFADHLRRYNWLLRKEHDLKAALKQVLHQKRCPDEMMFYRLLRAGLVKGTRQQCTCRCDLYRMYFEQRLS